MEIEYIEAKTILSSRKDNSSWFGFDYNMNIYKGCSHGCIYCDSRSDCYQIDNFDKVRPKKDALKILDLELAKKRFKGVVGTGAMSDPYNPLEKELELTRSALKLILKHGFGVVIYTKSDLVVRDIDILKEIAKNKPVLVCLTITTSNDDLTALIEPNVCNSTSRFEALRKLSKEGIYCGVIMMPILPFINDNKENVLEIVKKASQVNAKFVYSALGVTLRDNQRKYFYDKLDQNFEGIKIKYWNKFVNNYFCHINDVDNIRKLIKESCVQYNILYAMKDIIKDYKQKYEVEQLSLF